MKTSVRLDYQWISYNPTPKLNPAVNLIVLQKLIIQTTIYTERKVHKFTYHRVNGKFYEAMSYVNFMFMLLTECHRVYPIKWVEIYNVSLRNNVNLHFSFASVYML